MKDIANQAKYFLMFLIFVFGYFIYLVYSNFLFTIIIATLLIIGTINIHNRINAYIKNNIISSIALTLILAISFFFPIFYFINHLANDVAYINIDTLKGILDSATLLVKQTAQKINLTYEQIEQYIPSINPSEAIGYMLNISQRLGKIGVNFVTDVSIVLIFYFFILIYKDKIGSYLKNIIPLQDNDQQEIVKSLANTMSIVYSSTLLTAFLEGCLFAIIVVIYGYDGFLFGMLYGFASLIPVIGGLLVWVPISLYELSIGNTTNAIVIAIYTIIVISIIADTFIKPMIITMVKKSISLDIHYYIHEYIIFFAILAGMTSFGFWGIIIGPAVTTIFLTLLHLYSAKQKHKG